MSEPLKPILLASSSPRRSDLLREAGVCFRVEPAKVEEKEGKGARETALFNAELKAGEVAQRFPGEIILAADTVVALEDQLLGKPVDESDAFRMLRLLAGRTHSVLTGVCLIGSAGRAERFAVESRVRFRELTDGQIREYIRDVFVMDKAGSYALQEEGARIVASVEGSRTNVIGLPMEEVLQRIESGHL